MPRRKQPVLESKTARDILAELENYGVDRKFQPVQNALFNYMTRWDKEQNCPVYDITIGEFNHWFDRLVNAGHIEVDDITRSVRAVQIDMVRRDEYA